MDRKINGNIFTKNIFIRNSVSNELSETIEKYL